MMPARKHTAGPVIRIEVERRFEVSGRQGFDYITEPASRPEYWPRFVRIDPGSHWHDRGDRARLTLRMLGRDVKLNMTLARREPMPSSGLHKRATRHPGSSPQQPLRQRRRRRCLSHHHRIPAPRTVRHRVLDRTLVRATIARTARGTMDNLQRRFHGEQQRPVGAGDDSST